MATLSVAEYNEFKTAEFIPEIVFVGTLSAIGLVGNAVAMLFYCSKKFKTVNVFLLTSVSVSDLIASVVNAFLIYQVMHSVTYESDIMCKIHGFLLHFFTANSTLLLVPLAIDRFYCVVLVLSSRRFTMKAGRCMVVVMFGLSLILAVPELVKFSTAKKINVTTADNITLVGKRCLFNDDTVSMAQIMFHALDIVIIVVVIVLLIILYSSIVLKLFVKKSKKAKDLKRMKNGDSNDRTKESIEECEKADNEKDNSNFSGEIREDTNPDASLSGITVNTHDENSVATHLNATHKTDAKKENEIRLPSKSIQMRKRVQRNVTKMTFMITFVSLLSYVGYFYVRLDYKGHDDDLPVGKKILYRTLMFNSCVNPYIIGLFNTEFRRFVWRCVTCKHKRAS